MAKKTKTKKKSKDTKLEFELRKLGKDAEKVFVESEDNPDDFKKYPKIVVCSLDPGRYIYPMMIKLENSNIVKLESLNNYIPCVLRLIELVKWSMDLRLRRKRQTTSEKGKVLITNEFILEKIPACRT